MNSADAEPIGAGTKAEGRRRLTCAGYAPVLNLVNRYATVVALPGTDQLFLLLRLRLDLNPARLDTVLEREAQPQHSVTMRGGEFVDIQELRNRERLLIARSVLV